MCIKLQRRRRTPLQATRDFLAAIPYLACLFEDDRSLRRTSTSLSPLFLCDLIFVWFASFFIWFYWVDLGCHIARSPPPKDCFPLCHAGGRLHVKLLRQERFGDFARSRSAPGPFSAVLAASHPNRGPPALISVPLAPTILAPFLTLYSITTPTPLSPSSSS